ncbi:MAG: DUF885 domain-containing protein [Candidatus Bipolaricaulaceae bacterium]
MTEAERIFYERVQFWLDRLLEENPVAATALGDHRFDHRLADHSRTGLSRQERLLREAAQELSRFDRSALGLDARIDHELVRRMVQSFLRDFEVLRGFARNPAVYVNECLGGIFLLLARNFAPFPRRLESVLSRLREIPRVLTEATELIEPEEVPPAWAEIAAESIRRGQTFFKFLPAFALGCPRLLPAILRASRTADRALAGYLAFVEEKVKPKAQGNFAVGEKIFEEILREDHLLSYTAEELWRLGQELMRITREEMESLAARISPQKRAKEILAQAKADHPKPTELLPTYRREVARARDFLLGEKVVTIPEGESLRVEPTPLHLRPTIPFAAYMMPGPLEAKQEGIFFVTPVDRWLPPKAREEKLRGHYRAKIPVTVVHEAYPGHHLQLVFANRYAQTLPRKLGSSLSSLFVEGWAFYCEELMESLGYLNDPLQKLARLSDQLWRAARIVLDVSLHVRGIRVEEAVAFLEKEVGMERTNALAEVRRYTMSPTQPLSYLVGKLELLKVIEEYKKARPNATLQEIHDAILAQGSIPPALLRRRLLGG